MAPGTQTGSLPFADTGSRLGTEPGAQVISFTVVGVANGDLRLSVRLERLLAGRRRTGCCSSSALIRQGLPRGSEAIARPRRYGSQLSAAFLRVGEVDATDFDDLFLNSVEAPAYPASLGAPRLPDRRDSGRFSSRLEVFEFSCREDVLHWIYPFELRASRISATDASEARYESVAGDANQRGQRRAHSAAKLLRRGVDILDLQPQLSVGARSGSSQRK